MMQIDKRCQCHNLMSVQCILNDKMGINEQLKGVISDMLHWNPNDRPSLDSIKQRLQKIQLECDKVEDELKWALCNDNIPRVSGILTSSHQGIKH